MKLKLKPHAYPGKLIVFEGTDGAGKTTMLERTREYLAGVVGEENVVVTKQPTDRSRNTRLFQKMMYCKRHEDVDYRAVQLLTMSDRVQHAYEQIEPALRAGKYVVCDRYIYTSLVNMLARGYTHEKWFFDAAQHLPAPDLAVLAYVPPELAIARIRARPEEARRHLDEAQLRKVADGFLRLHKQLGLRLTDTTQPADKAFIAVRAAVDALLPACAEARVC